MLKKALTANQQKMPSAGRRQQDPWVLPQQTPDRCILHGIKTATGDRACKMRELFKTRSRVLRTCHERSHMPFPAIKPALRGDRGLYQCRVELKANRNRRKNGALAAIGLSTRTPQLRRG
jgi:hypothetical protein